MRLSTYYIFPWVSLAHFGVLRVNTVTRINVLIADKTHLHNRCDLTSDKTNLMLQYAIKPLSLNRDRFRERVTSSVKTANFALQTDLFFNAVQGGFGVSDVDVGCSHGWTWGGFKAFWRWVKRWTAWSSCMCGILLSQQAYDHHLKVSSPSIRRLHQTCTNITLLSENIWLCLKKIGGTREVNSFLKSLSRGCYINKNMPPCFGH